MDKKLLDKYFSGKCTEEEFIVVMNYFLNENNKTEALNDIEASWYDYSSSEKFKNHQLSFIKSRLNETLAIKQRHVWLITMKIAASLVIIILFGIGVFYYLDNNNNEKLALETQPKLITKENPKGQKLKISLKDGSSIILNADSRVVYDDGFGIDNRNIQLVGEAFFEVAENANIPFKVNAGPINIVALGTSFNVQNYVEDKIEKVALATGKVKVSSGSNQLVTLEPGEMVQYQDQQFSEKRKFDASEVIGWKDGMLVFRNSSLSEVVQKLERWYGVEIKIENANQYSNWSYTGSYNNVSLENVLNGISFTKGIDFQIVGEKVKIKL